MQGTKICLWFDGQAEEATGFYAGIFRNSQVNQTARYAEGTPGGLPGKIMTVVFTLDGQQYLALNGGPAFHFTPAASFFVSCDTEEEIDELYSRFDARKILMPLQKYPFNEKYAWIEDRYGLSWQLFLGAGKQKITPFLMFVGKQCGKAEEAVHFYSSVFKNADVEKFVHDEEGRVKHVAFTLGGQGFMAMDSALEHHFTFNEAFSIIVNCDTQEEIDYYWEKLSEGGKEVECGWLKDKYGMSWQIVPAILSKLMQSADKEKSKRVMQALMKMVKLDIAKLEQA